MLESNICTTVNYHTKKIKDIHKKVCDIKQSSINTELCPVILGEGSSGPDSSVVLGCDALGSDESVVVGNDATSQGNSRNVVIGYMANANNTDSVVIGHMAEGNTGSIVIGKDSKSNGNNSIVVGKNANLFEDNSILLDATDNDTSGKFYVKPVRELNAPNMLCYNTGTGEISYQPKTDKVPDGNCYSDYLFWDEDNNKWENGNSDDYNRVHIGCGAGQVGQQEDTIAIGNNAGNNSQQGAAIAIGNNAGQNIQGSRTISIGLNAGKDCQEQQAIAIGNNAGNTDQKTKAIAIGDEAGRNNQQQNSIAIGQKADLNGFNNNTIILNAQSNMELDSTGPNSFYVKPIRGTGSTRGLCNLIYNPTTGEIIFGILQSF